MGLREQLNISRLALRHPRPTVVLWCLVAIAGVAGFRLLKYALLPDITFPLVVVTVKAPLDNTTEIERLVAGPVERAVASVDGVKKVRSISLAAKAVVSIEFRVGVDLAEAGRRVERALEGLSLPPNGTTEVRPVDLNESSVVTYAVVSHFQKNLDVLRGVAIRKVAPELEKVPGVLAVRPLGVGPTLVMLNGLQAAGLQVVKRGGANTLEVAEDVERTIRSLQQDFPGIYFVPVAAQADYIQDATNATVDALLIAVFLSVIVIFPFLRNLSATAISALAIPASLLATFIVMAAADFNLETITLLALALVIGIIIDDAIVDVENIARHIEDGEPADTAALHATNEIGLTVTAATFTIVAVFLPVGFMGGVTGRFFKPFGLTVSAAVIASLLVARTLSPVLAARWLKPGHRSQGARWHGLVTRYRRILDWSLRHPAFVILVALGSLAGGLAITPLIPKGFIPRLDRGEFIVQYRVAGKPTLDSTFGVGRRFEAAIRSDSGVASVFLVAGTLTGAENRGAMRVTVAHDKGLTTAEVKRRIREHLPSFEGVSTSVEDIPFIEIVAAKPFEMGLVGDDLDQLAQAADTLQALLRAQGDVADVSVSGLSRDSAGPMEIEHFDGHRVAWITANLADSTSLGTVMDRTITQITPALPPSVRLELGGDTAQAASLFGDFAPTMLLAVVCVVAVLGLLFQSVIDPIAIAISLPLTAVGAMLALFLTRSDFGVVSLIGLIFLLGLASKNAILLVDYTNQLVAGGTARRDAILAAGSIRLRPILMTTAATLLGMLPIALGIGAGAELRAPMAIAIMGGLVTSTLLSLVVVPVVYDTLHRIKRRNAEG